MGYVIALVVSSLAVIASARHNDVFARQSSTCLEGSAGSVSSVCNMLQGKFPEDVFLQGNASYTSESKAIWDLAAVLDPGCVFTPIDSDELAQGLAIITGIGADFTVRSGGHMPVFGHNSIGSGGVMITTIHFTEMQTVATPNPFDQSYVRAGSAFRWQQLYEYLGNQSLIVNGGRVASVGSSLLLGGGLSYFSGFTGWAANNIVNYEVLLANSSVIQVNNFTAPDLYWALKGGSSNFGIVTRYDIATREVGNLFGGTVVWPANATQRYLDAQTAFILPGGGSDDPNAAIMPNFDYDPNSKQSVPGTVMVYNQAIENPKALENFTSIPTTFSTVGVQPFANITESTNGYSPRTRRWSFYSTAVLSAPETMNLIHDHIRTVADQRLSGLNATTGAAVQPITTQHLQAARHRGGDALDLDPARGAFVIALVYVSWYDAADDAAVGAYNDAVISSIEADTKARGLYYPWKFLNDAGPGQDPVGTYGYGASLPRLRAVSAKYDPAGVFQRKVPGFKLAGEVPSCP